MKQVIIYTDGACSKNPGPGGWGAYLEYKGKNKKLSGFQQNTTNNQMELLAAIQALRILKEPCKVELYSDSAYLIDSFTKGWIYNWKKNNWRRGKEKEEVKNVELWEELYKYNQVHDIIWIKVKGHSDNEFNNLCDKLATDEIKKNVK